MTPEAHNIQFSRQIWQTVSEHAHTCLMRREFCPEQSRIENLRCVEFKEEGDECYGQQIWYFEAIGVDPVGRRHVLHGALEFSIQYGLLESSQAVMFEDEEVRDRFVTSSFGDKTSFLSSKLSRKYWIITISSLLGLLAAVWTFAFVSLLNQ